MYNNPSQTKLEAKESTRTAPANCKPGASDAINISSPFSTSCRLLESCSESLPPDPAVWKAITVNADDEDSPGGKGESSRRKPNTLPQCADDFFPGHQQ